MNDFNIGDYAFYKDYPFPFFISDINQYNFCSLNIDNNIVNIHKNDLVLWEPKDEEYCWFFDHESFTPILAKFIGVIYNNNYLASVSNGKGSLRLKEFKYCKPFSGSIIESCNV
jgi:hypothetical protein